MPDHDNLAARKEGFRALPVQGFTVPSQWQGQQVLLVPASPEWVELDFKAVIESRSKLKHLFGPGDTWPPDNLDISMNSADLAWHAREFESRRSFAYHLLSHDKQNCLGCLYIYPTASTQHQAEAYLWTHINLSTERARLIEDEIISWTTRHWPIEAIAWPGRLIPFSRWEQAAIPNYYATKRMVQNPALDAPSTRLKL